MRPLHQNKQVDQEYQQLETLKKYMQKLLKRDTLLLFLLKQLLFVQLTLCNDDRRCRHKDLID